MIPTSNLASLLLQTARRLPDRPALVWRDSTWTWSALAGRVMAAAGALRARGIGPATACSCTRATATPSSNPAGPAG